MCFGRCLPFFAGVYDKDLRRYTPPGKANKRQLPRDVDAHVRTVLCACNRHDQDFTAYLRYCNHAKTFGEPFGVSSQFLLAISADHGLLLHYHFRRDPVLLLNKVTCTDTALACVTYHQPILLFDQFARGTREPLDLIRLWVPPLLPFFFRFPFLLLY